MTLRKEEEAMKKNKSKLLQHNFIVIQNGCIKCLKQQLKSYAGEKEKK